MKASATAGELAALTPITQPPLRPPVSGRHRCRQSCRLAGDEAALTVNLSRGLERFVQINLAVLVGQHTAQIRPALGLRRLAREWLGQKSLSKSCTKSEIKLNLFDEQFCRSAWCLSATPDPALRAATRGWRVWTASSPSSRGPPGLGPGGRGDPGNAGRPTSPGVLPPGLRSGGRNDALGSASNLPALAGTKAPQKNLPRFLLVTH